MALMDGSVSESESTRSDDVKLMYLKTLETGEAKFAIADFADSGRIDKEVLRVLERKIGQPQTTVSAHSKNLKTFYQ